MSRWLAAAGLVAPDRTDRTDRTQAQVVQVDPDTRSEGVLSVKSVLSGGREAIAASYPPAAIRDAFEERAAIREFDGNQSRVEAEAAARAEMHGDPWPHAMARVWANFEAMNDPYDPRAWA